VTVRVKICGVTNVADAQTCATAGADAIGLNFWRRSKRFVEVARASAIARALPRDVLKIGVFVDALRREIEGVIDAVGLDAIQLHGHETPQDCCGFAVKVIKAISMRPGSESAAALAERYAADFILLDAEAGERRGGSGSSFDWRQAVDVAPGRLFLAGGLRPDNVAEAVRMVAPYAVDVASGVESAPGTKDAELVKEFIHNAKHA
jgi:phosphoribosylanthranilate isomerase